MPTVTVWLIRHGESLSNAGHPTLGPEFTGLTPLGMKQAEAITHIFPRSPALIVMSKYRRTQETAQPTIRRFPDVGWEVWPDVHEFTYLSWSHSEGTTEQERQRYVDEFWQRNDPFYADGDGSEKFIQFMSRVSSALERLRYSKEDFIAVFTHGYFMRAAWWYLQNRPTRIDSRSMEEFYGLRSAFDIPNGAILPIELRGREDFTIGKLIVPPLLLRREKSPRVTISAELRLLASAACNVGL
jgi:probable phosphoglycerate mutase